MLKRDIAGLLRIYCIAGFFFAYCVFGFVGTIRSMRTFWAQDGFAYHFFDSLVLLFLLLASALIIFLLARAHKKWLRLERVRNHPDSFPLHDLRMLSVPTFMMDNFQINDLQQYNPDSPPLYDLQWLYTYLLTSQDDEKPPALKKMMARRDIIRIIQALSVLFFVILLIVLGFVLVAVAISGHSERIVEVAFLVVLGFVGLAILEFPVVYLVIMLEYERIEASEHGLTRQHGLVRRFIPWDEVRLFAVGGKAGRGFEWVELSGAKALVRWPFALKSAGVFSGPSYAYLVRESPELPYQVVTRGEYLDQLQRVYRYVQQRTDQPLRDLRL